MPPTRSSEDLRRGHPQRLRPRLALQRPSLCADQRLRGRRQRARQSRDTAANEGLNNVALQQDYLFRVEEGGYYGHPNPLRDEFVLNGGNPTSGTDPNQATTAYPVGTQPDPNYRLDSAYGLGFNRSPNGAVEYTSNVFGSSLKDALLFTEFSGGNDIRAVLFDANGHRRQRLRAARPRRQRHQHLSDPLDVIVNPTTGQIYLLTLNRSNGQSQLIRLDPAPGGRRRHTPPTSGGDLTFTPVDLDDPAAAIFTITGLDADITALTVSFDGGVTTRTIAAANGQVTLDLSALGFGTLTATLRAQDASGNVATISTSFVLERGRRGRPRQPRDHPGRGQDARSTAPPSPSPPAAARRSRSATPRTWRRGTNAALVNGLRPGAYGLDGNTNNLDGTPGGYADFGTTNADFLTFTFNVPAGQAGRRCCASATPTATARRHERRQSPAVGRDQRRAGRQRALRADAPAPPPTSGWRTGRSRKCTVTLVAGTNTVTLRSVNNIGPNIDQLEVLVPTAVATPYDYYEAENAQLIGGPVVVPTSDRRPQRRGQRLRRLRRDRVPVDRLDGDGRRGRHLRGGHPLLAGRRPRRRGRRRSPSTAAIRRPCPSRASAARRRERVALRDRARCSCRRAATSSP